MNSGIPEVGRSGTEKALALPVTILGRSPEDGFWLTWAQTFPPSIRGPPSMLSATCQPEATVRQEREGPSSTDGNQSGLRTVSRPPLRGPMEEAAMGVGVAGTTVHCL